MGKIDKILFVDDDHVCSFLNVSLVEDLKIAREVKSVPSAADALNYIKLNYTKTRSTPAAAPDLIFLDIKMPGMDGFEMLQELEKDRSIDRSRFLIVLLTTMLNSADEEKTVCNSDRVFACMIKPLSEENLINLLHEMHAH